MNNKKRVIVSTALFVAILIFSFVEISKERNKDQDIQTEQKIESQIILFYGKGCPHCEIVEKYLQTNKVQEKISFSEKEVFYNKNNSKELEKKAVICKIPLDSIGVPLLWDGEKCLVGDKDIIEFFKNKLKTQQ